MTMWLPVPILSAGKRSDVGVSSITPGVLSHQRLTVFSEWRKEHIVARDAKDRLSLNWLETEKS